MKTKIFIYDFDGTLTPYPITKVGVLEECGFEGGMMSSKFMGMVRERRLFKNLDLYTACYQILFEVLKEHGFLLTYDNFGIGALELELNKGVYEFLEEMCFRNVNSYIVSSGSKDFLEHTVIAKFFKEIYATTFKYENNEAVEPEILVSDRKKVDIVKKILVDNGYKDDDCCDLVYVGDGLTDLYAMEYIKNNGGTTVFVYLDEENDSLKSAKEVDVVSFFCKADYSKNGEFYHYVTELLKS